MSDSDSEIVAQNGAAVHQIKPSNAGASIDTSTWPLLLKVSNADINLYPNGILSFDIFQYYLNTPLFETIL